MFGQGDGALPSNYLEQNVARVSSSGNDSSGKIGNFSKPFKTVQAAIKAFESTAHQRPSYIAANIDIGNLSDNEDVVTSLTSLNIQGANANGLTYFNSLTFTSNANHQIRLTNLEISELDIPNITGGKSVQIQLQNAYIDTSITATTNTNILIEGYPDITGQITDVTAGQIYVTGVFIDDGTLSATNGQINLNNCPSPAGGYGYQNAPSLNATTNIYLTNCVVKEVTACLNLFLKDSRVIGTNTAPNIVYEDVLLPTVLETETARVDTSCGDDTNGVVGDPGKPFTTVQAAINAIEAGSFTNPAIDIGYNNCTEDVTTSLTSIHFVGKYDSHAFDSLTVSSSESIFNLTLDGCGADDVFISNRTNIIIYLAKTSHLNLVDVTGSNTVSIHGDVSGNQNVGQLYSVITHTSGEILLDSVNGIFGDITSAGGITMDYCNASESTISASSSSSIIMSHCLPTVGNATSATPYLLPNINSPSTEVRLSLSIVKIQNCGNLYLADARVQGANGATGSITYHDVLLGGVGASGYSGYSGKSGYSGYSGQDGVIGVDGQSGYSGFCGLSGYSGFSGKSGYSGFSGPSGYSGYCGLSGYSGFCGLSGYSGFCGLSGYSGFCGLSGYSGFCGLSGYSGFCGLSGYSGFSGKSGYSGFCGLSGYSGFCGLSGYSGFSGPSGYSGFCGLSGYSGYSGSGISGYSGYSGSGLSGYSGFCGLSGYSGYSGSGVSGYSGYSGSGLSGYSGFCGLSGYSGFCGLSGYSGFSGDPAQQSGYSGYSGPSGYSGFCGLSGYSGFCGLSGYSGFCGLSGYSGFCGLSGYSGYSGPGLAKVLFVEAAEIQEVGGTIVSKAGTVTGAVGVGSSLFLQRILIPAVMNITEIDVAMSIGFPATNQGAGTMSRSMVIYSLGNSTSLASVVSTSGASVWSTGTSTTAGAASLTQFQGGWSTPLIQPMTFAASSLAAGEYVVGQLFNFAQASSTWTLGFYGILAETTVVASAATNLTSATLGALSSGGFAAASGITGISSYASSIIPMQWSGENSASGITGFTLSPGAVTGTIASGLTATVIFSGSGTIKSSATLWSLIGASSNSNLISSIGVTAGSIHTATASLGAVTNVGLGALSSSTLAQTTLPNFGYIGTGSTTSNFPTVFINGIMSTGAIPTAITLTSTAVTYSGSAAFQQPWFALIGT